MGNTDYQKIFFATYIFNIENCAVSVILDKAYSTLTPEKKLFHKLKNIHYHTYYEFFFIGDGELAINQKNSSEVFKSGAVCIKPFFPHYSKRNGEIFRFYFSFEKIKKASGIFYENLSSLFSENRSLLNMNEKIYLLLRRISEIGENDRYRTEKIKYLLGLVFIELVSDNIRTDSHSENEENYAFLIETMISGSYDKKLKLKELAECLHVSVKHASRLVLKYYKKPLSSLVNERKMQIAAYLLTDTHLSVSEISEYLCFDTENYFYSTFKKTYGISPLKYRKNNQIE